MSAESVKGYAMHASTLGHLVLGSDFFPRTWSLMQAESQLLSCLISHSIIARHNEKRRAVEFIDRSQPFRVVILLDLNDFLFRRHIINRHAIVEPTMDADQAAVLLPQNQIEGEVAECHGDNGIERVGITRTHEITESLIDDVDPAAIVVLR